MPDIVLIDLLIPIMDGISAIRKTVELDSKAKIVVVTAITKASIRYDALKAGAVGFVIRPFETSSLLKAVSDACAA